MSETQAAILIEHVVMIRNQLGVLLIIGFGIIALLVLIAIKVTK